MTFREGLETHLAAIQGRDIEALAATLPGDGRIALITADGKLIRSSSEFLRLHADWFSGQTWKLETELVETFESADFGVAILKLDYRDDQPSGEPLREASYLTLVFRREDEKWVMVQDQNTPVRSR